MRVFDATRNKIGEWAVKAAAMLSPVYSYGSMFQNLWGVVREPFTGAWQKNVECESTKNILAFSAVYACVSLIADDISKLRLKLVQLQADGTWQEVTTSPFVPFLRKPNRYQTRIQFLSQWLVSKLLQGNAYILKERDQRGVVIAGYVLDPRKVVPLVSDDGDVYYQLKYEALAGVGDDGLTVPASEIIHDRMICPWHPLIGVTPVYACGASSTQGIRIQAMSAKFFENMSRPSGHLSAPTAITDDFADTLKKRFEAAFSGGKIGRLFVTGGGLKYEPMTMPAQDAQLIEQLRWTVEDVARAFHVPQYKLGGTMPTFNNGAALNQEYYTQTLQTHIEAIELLLDEALGLGASPNSDLGVELDLDGLMRMDPLSRAERAKALAGIAKIDELRLVENLAPTPGGDAVYLQEQNYSLEALAKRDAGPDPFAKAATTAPAPAPTALPESQPPKAIYEPTAKDLAADFIARISQRATPNV
jgi:HK97 family phage portal protein